MSSYISINYPGQESCGTGLTLCFHSSSWSFSSSAPSPSSSRLLLLAPPAAGLSVPAEFRMDTSWSNFLFQVSVNWCWSCLAEGCGVVFSGGGNTQEGVFDISVWGYRRRRGVTKMEEVTEGSGRSWILVWSPPGVLQVLRLKCSLSVYL